MLLCENVVRERALAESEGGSGNHRGVQHLVGVALIRYDLIANGKPHGSVETLPVKEKSPLELLRDKRRAMA
jgi:hypothetical protein